MNLSDLVQNINLLADEDFETSEVVIFLNDAISRINIECSSNFPLITGSDTAYTAFPDKWQKTLLVPFGVGRLKQLDSAQFEYTDAYNEFINNLIEFRSKYTIPEEYKDLEAIENPLQDDFFGSPWF